MDVNVFILQKMIIKFVCSINANCKENSKSNSYKIKIIIERVSYRCEKLRRKKELIFLKEKKQDVKLNENRFQRQGKKRKNISFYEINLCQKIN